MKLAESEKCSGCSACAAACAKKAITMKPDAEGFLRPSVDAAKCVECGMCAKACPSLAQDPPRQPLGVYAARAKDFGLRKASSSGGVFTLLARETLAAGGVVFGAVWDRATQGVRHVAAESEEGLAAMRGSKYVQSDLGDTLTAARAALKAGRQVLFSGTPCQIAGLRRFLGRGYDNLLAVDTVCHAIPSPLAWRTYAADRRSEVGSAGDVEKAAFRVKNPSWWLTWQVLEFSDGKRYAKSLVEDLFRRGFLLDLFNRPSCHACSCRELRSGSDLTLADYWCVHQKFPELDDDRGVSLILVNTERGAEAWRKIGESLTVRESDFEHAVKTNPSIVKSFPPHENRSRFFSEVEANGFDSTVSALTKPIEVPPEIIAFANLHKDEP